MAPATTTTAKSVPKTAMKQAPKPAEKPAEKFSEKPVEQGPPKLSDFGDRMDQGTFEQILEMDDDDDKEFSKSIVYGFFDQADNTFKKMEDALKDEDLPELSQLGHFLKGSSATLGLTKVKEACEKIQHYGAQKDETGTTDEPDDKVSLDKIKKTLVDVKRDYNDVQVLLRRFYGEKVADLKASTDAAAAAATADATDSANSQKKAEP